MTQVPTEKLSQVPIFSFLPQPALERLAGVARIAELGANEQVIREGDPAKTLYIIEQGTVAVLKNGQQMLALLGPGDHFGEMSLLDARAASASVRTREACAMWCVSRDDFDQLMDRDSEYAVDLYKGIVAALCERLRTANENMSTLMAAI